MIAYRSGYARYAGRPTPGPGSATHDSVTFGAHLIGNSKSGTRGASHQSTRRTGSAGPPGAFPRGEDAAGGAGGSLYTDIPPETSITAPLM